MVTPLVEQLPVALTALVLCVPRLIMFMFMTTLFPQMVFPRTLKVGIAVGLSAPVAFGVFHELLLHPPQLDIAALVLKECVLGLLIGLVVAGPFWAMQSVGALIDNQRGANAGAQMTPFSHADASLIGSALQQALVVVLAASGVLVLLYQLLLLSYQVWPVLQIAPDLAPYGFDLATQRFDEWLSRTLLFAAPVLAVILLVDFAFAIITLFAPQLQTYFAAIPIKSLAAIAVLGVYVFMLLSYGEDFFRETLHRESTMMKSRSP
jgi:type III secretion protein T